MSTKKFYEFRLSRIEALLSLFALVGCVLVVFILGAFIGRFFFQSSGVPAAPPVRQNPLPNNPVADYGTLGSLNTAADESNKTVSQFSFYETLPKNVEQRPLPQPTRPGNQTVHILPPAQTVSRGKPADPASGGGAYTIQIAAFRQSEKAYALADKLTKQGYPVRVISSANAKGESWHRVRVGRFNTPEEAQRLFPELSKIPSEPQITSAEE